jgi:ribosomal protein L30E
MKHLEAKLRTTTKTTKVLIGIKTTMRLRKIEQIWKSANMANAQ